MRAMSCVGGLRSIKQARSTVSDGSPAHFIAPLVDAMNYLLISIK
jgi:hypothetical protein